MNKLIIFGILGGFLALWPLDAIAACTSPAANEGAIEYFSTANTHKFCDGTNWLAHLPASCTGAGNALQWDGTSWSCQAVGGGGSSGSFQFTDAGDACNAGNEGIILYDSAATLVICNGTSWQTLAGGPPPCSLWEVSKKVSCGGSSSSSGQAMADKPTCQANCEGLSVVACQWQISTSVCTRYFACDIYNTTANGDYDSVRCVY